MSKRSHDETPIERPREILVRFKGDPLRAALRAACCEDYKGETILLSQPLQLICLNEDGNVFSNMAYWPRSESTGLRVIQTLQDARAEVTEYSTLQVSLLDAMRCLTYPGAKAREYAEDTLTLCKHFGLTTIADMGVLRRIHDAPAESVDLSSDKLYRHDLAPHLHTLIFWQYA